MDSRILLLVSVVLSLEANAEGEDGSLKPEYGCREGWYEIGDRCYYYVKTPRTFQKAMKVCNKNMAVIDDEDTNTKLRGIIPSDAWIALQGDRDSYYWLTPRIRYGLPYVNFDGKMPVLSKKECGYLKPDGFWSTSSCSTKKAAICSQPRDCAADRWGRRCDRECHCFKQCNRESGTCPFGCQREWVGYHCNIRRRKATAKFFCLQQKDGHIALLSVDKGDAPLGTLAALDSNGVPSTTCTKDKFSRVGNTLNLQIIYQQNAFDPDCSASKVGNETFKWVFKAQELAGTDSFLDVQFEFQCNFSENTTGLKAEVPLTIDSSADNTVALTQTEVTTKMTVVDATSGRPVTNVTLGQLIQVKLDIPEGKNDSVTFSPRTCVARSKDLQTELQLTDERGCYRSNTGFGKLTPMKGGYYSMVFPAFRLPGHSSVDFVCDLVPCYPEGPANCKTTILQEKQEPSENGISHRPSILVHVPCSRYRKRSEDSGTEGLATSEVAASIHVR